MMHVAERTSKAQRTFSPIVAQEILDINAACEKIRGRAWKARQLLFNVFALIAVLAILVKFFI